MRTRTASSFTSAAWLALACGVLTSGVGCEARAPDPIAPAPMKTAPAALCPATMQGAGEQKFPLSGLSVMRFEESTGWKNVQPAADAAGMSWTLVPATGVQYRAVCEYDEEIIAVPIDAAFRRCRVERSAGDAVTTWCER